MRSARIAIGLVVCGWLASCGQGGCVIFNHPYAPDGGACRFDELRFQQFLISGQMAPVQFGIDESCYADVPEVFSSIPNAVVEVHDPDGNRVVHLETTPVRRQDGTSHYENVATVAFTPDRPGAWRLSADFGAEIGKTVQKIEAVDLRKDAQVRVIQWNGVPPNCLGFEVSDRGTALCVTQVKPDPPQVSTSTGQVLEGESFALFGNVLWRLTSAQGTAAIERLEDDGTKFVRTHILASPFAARGVMSARGDRAWLLSHQMGSPNPLTLVELEPAIDGGIEVTARAVPGAASVALAVGGDSSVAVTGARTLALAAGAGVRSLEYAGRLGGADGELLWFSANSDPSSPANSLGEAIELRAVRPEGDDLRSVALPMPRRSQLSFSRPYFGVPLVPMSAESTLPGAPAVEFAIPRAGAGAISLEMFDVGVGYAPVGAATSRHAFARALDGQSVKVFDR